MRSELAQEQIDFYQKNGFVVIDNFLDSAELEHWRESVTEAVKERNGQKMPGKVN